MSSNKKFKKIDDNYRRDSFEDRVCDDLCEVLLQFLPIEDKFGFECVSKQFQRTVFERQYEINLNDLNVRNRFKIFGPPLKKLPNLMSLGFEKSNLRYKSKLNDSDFDSIIKYCHKLKKLNIDLSPISDLMKDSFVEKFSQKLVSIYVTDREVEWIQKSFPKLEEVICSSLYCSFNFKNLKKLVLTDLIWCNSQSKDQYIKHLENLFENNKTLTHLAFDSRFEDKELLNTVFDEITKLDQLVSLKINVDYYENRQFQFMPFINTLDKMSVNCPKLKSLIVDSRFTSLGLVVKFGSIVKKFKALKRLRFGLFIRYRENVNRFEEFFSGLQSLTHLSVDMPKDILINGLLKDIDIHLPELQNLAIKSQYFQVSKHSVKSLCRLSKLETIHLNVRYGSKHTVESKLLEKCKRIKSIDLKTK